MAVETYLIDEVSNLITESEDLEQWKQAVDELKLEGQKALAAPQKSPIPFPQMNAQMMLVYQTLCPARIDVTEYQGSAIPLRVLSLISLAQKELYFQEIEIWSDNKKVDPIAVGITHPADRTWDKTRYLIGRWGDELRSYPELVEMAKRRFAEQKRVELNEKIVEAQHNLANVEIFTASQFDGGFIRW